MATLFRATVTSALLALFASPVFAHYLWVTVDKKAGSNGATNIYFEGGPSAGDGHYLDHFTKTGKTWIRTIEHLEPKLVKTKDTTKGKKRWLSAELPYAGPRSIDSYGKFGVYKYGNTNVLLHYYARNLDLNTHEALHELARAKQMELDIVPHDHAGEMELRVLWQGKSAAGRMVYIRGPKGFKSNIKTGEDGIVKFKVGNKGAYTFRTSVEEPKSGVDAGMSYSLIRHNATLNMVLPLEK